MIILQLKFLLGFTSAILYQMINRYSKLFGIMIVSFIIYIGYKAKCRIPKLILKICAVSFSAVNYFPVL